MVSRVKLQWHCIAFLVAGLPILSGCQGLQSSSDGGGNANSSLQSINHIIFMAQENRSFDTYFGQLPAYWAANGYLPQTFDGIPAGASNPSFDGTTRVTSYHVATECIENLSPSWNESHQDWNRYHPISKTPQMDGFVFNAAKFAIDEGL